MKKGFLMNKQNFWANDKIRRKIILLLTIVSLGLGWYGLSVFRPWDINITVPGTGRKLPDYVFQDIVLTSVSGSQVSYRVSADSFTLDRSNGFLTQVTGSVLDKNGLSNLDFTAQSGVIDINKQSCVFITFSGYTFSRQLWKITAGEALWDSRKQDFTLTKQPRIFNAETQITAKRMIYNATANYFMIEQDCEVHKDEHVLKSDRAVFQNNLLTLEKNVSLSGDDFTLQADNLEWNTLRDELTIRNNINLHTEGLVLTGSQVSMNSDQSMIYLQENVRFYSEADKFLVNTDRAVWDRQKKQIEFFENTKAWKDNSLLESDQLIYDFEKNDLLADGSGRTRLIRNSDE